MITQDDIIYFIITDRFNDGDATNNFVHDTHAPRDYHGGDLQGIVDKIGYLQHLGVTAVWITPVYVNTQGTADHRPYHYYWPKDFDQMDPRLCSGMQHEEGSMLYLADFVQTMHRHGIKVILDVVVNHGGYEIQQESDTFDDSWFNDPTISVEEDPDDGSLSGLPDFDHDNINVVDYFIHNLIKWIEVCRIDGLRMDTAFHIENKFWYYYKSQVRGKFPDMFIVGEVLRRSRHDIPMLADYQRDYDLNAVFDFPLRELVINCMIHDEPMYRIARPRLHREEEYGILDLDNSTTDKRIEGRGGYSNANRLVTLLDNHDIDQRIISVARGRHTGEGGKQMAYRIVKMCYAFLFTVRGIPQLYYGSEAGLEGWNTNTGGDADLRRDFPWSMLNGNEIKNEFPEEKKFFDTIRTLIETKKRNEALRYGVMITMWVDQFVYAFIRHIGNNVVLVIFNNGYGDMPQPLNIPVIRNADKTKQTLPDRIIDLMQANLFVNIFNTNDTVQTQETIAVQIPGKGFKIYALAL